MKPKSNKDNVVTKKSAKLINKFKYFKKKASANSNDAVNAEKQTQQDYFQQLADSLNASQDHYINLINAENNFADQQNDQYFDDNVQTSVSKVLPQATHNNRTTEVLVTKDNEQPVDDLVSWFDDRTEASELTGLQAISSSAGVNTSSNDAFQAQVTKYLDNDFSEDTKEGSSLLSISRESQDATYELAQVYQINNLAHKTNLFKIFYKDLSTKYFTTFLLLILIFFTGMVKIYLTYSATVKTTEFSRLQADYKKLSYYNSNLQLEYLYLTSDAHIRSILNQDAQRLLFLPIVNTREVIVVIPYNIYYSQLIRGQQEKNTLNR